MTGHVAVKAFLAARGPDAIDPAIANRVDELWRDATAAWPDFAFPAEDFGRDLATVVPEAALAALSGPDFYLARAAAAGDAHAVRELCSRVATSVRRIHARTAPAEVSFEEAVQAVRERLLLCGENGLPRIASYTGAAGLDTWLRVVAVRAVTDLARNRRKEVLAGEDELAHLPEAADDPELAFLKEHYRAAFKAAFHAAVDGLAPRQRNLLRHQLLRALSIDEIAALYGVHRATIARWLEDARDALRRLTRDAMQETCGVDRLQFASVIRLIQSRLEVSAHRALASRSALEREDAA
jgi:RNA polymerase sigma-70 factor, ECF subfamily